MATSEQQINTKEHKYYPVLDLVRFIAAILVMCIHVLPEGSTSGGIGFDDSIPSLIGLSFFYSLVRIAVPIFFVISGFLLFKRIEEDPENKWKYIGKFCLRLLFLYIFWYIVGLPLVIRDVSGFASQGDTYNLVRYIVITLWKGTPRGFWFLVSLAVSVLIVALIKSKKSLIVITIIASVMYIYGCLNSAYFGIFTLSDDPVSKAFYFLGDYFELYICPLQALIYVLLGKIFVIHGTFKIKFNVVLIPVAFVLMMGELFLTLYTKVFVYADAYFTLVLFVFLLMNLILQLDSQNKTFIKVAKKLKKVGSFSYMFHILFFTYLYWICDSTGHNIFREQFLLCIIPFFICLLLAFVLQTLFEYLSKYKYLKFFRYSY